MRFGLLYYKKFFLQEKSEFFKIKDIKIKNGQYIIECIDQQRSNVDIIFNDKVHKLYENKRIKSFNDIKKYFIVEDISTGDAGIGATGDQFSGDTYAPGDARNLYGGFPAITQRRNMKGIEKLVTKKRKKRKKSKKKKKNKK